MTTSPKTKKQKLTKKLILSAATRGSAGNWKDPNDESRDFSNSIEPWIKFAQIANRGKLHSIFFVDHLSWFDVYGGDHAKAAQLGVNAARTDPTAVVAALAQVTENLGFGITISTVSEHPYHFSRRLASLDQLTGGRVGWNIVASYLPSVGENLLNGAPLPEHDERYEKTQEYLDVLYDLLLSSWSDDALVYDKKKGVFADPERIRKINHEGKFFKIPGPAITEPTKQRFPLIVQAGTSERGKLFASENAELIYIGLHDYDRTAEHIATTRKTASEIFGRDPSSIKFIAPVNAFVGKTHEEAVAKQEAYKALQDPEESLVYFGGTSGIDVSKLDWDEPIPATGTNGIKGSLDSVIKKDGTPNNSKRQLVDKRLKERTKFVGTPEEVADLIEEAVNATDIDGLNFSTNSFPSGVEDIVDLLIPELQKRGLAQTEYAVPGGTFRENLYGVKGQTFVKEDHPAYNLRWFEGVSQDKFEKRLEEYKKLRDQRREKSLASIAVQE